MKTFCQYEEQARITRPDENKLVISALGLNGEAGEYSELVKKHLFHGHPLDVDACAKELGDILWYLFDAADAIGITEEEIAQRNIDKLRKRYPNAFNTERSMNR